MGFSGRILHLVWPEDHQLHGMEVRIRPASVAATSSFSTPSAGEDREAVMRRRLEVLCGHVVEWNLEHPATGEPLEKTPDGLFEFDAAAVGELIEAWLDGGRLPDPSKAEDPQHGRDREPVDPLGGSSGSGSGTGSSSEVEALIPVQDA